MTTAPIQTYDRVDIPEPLRENEVVGYGVSSWAVRVDAVAKCYQSRESHLREREIAVYGRLAGDGGCHNAVVPFYGVLDGRSVLLQFASNGSIRQYRANHSDVPLLTRMAWAERAASAVVFLHSKVVLHGNISCSSIFLDGQLSAKLGDFSGSSIDGSPFLAVYGTSHSAPDDTSVSARREIFALGSTLYEMMAGSQPFEGVDDGTVEQNFRQGHFPDLRPLPALGDVILGCWRGRYQTAKDVRFAVEQGAPYLTRT